MNKRIFLLLLILTGVTLNAQTKEIVRIASYNVKQYPGSVSNVKAVTAALRKIMNQIKPTILLTVELDVNTAVQQVRDSVLTPKYKASTEVTIQWGTGNECAVFYIDSLLTYLGSTMISSSPRPIAEFKFVHKITHDTLIVFGAHLKANTSTPATFVAERSKSVDDLRKVTNKLKPTDNYMVVGDFNILVASEPAFQKLIDQSTPGYVIDPLNSVAEWANNPITYSNLLTESATKLTARFDMILYSQAIKDNGGIEYITDSFKIFGNDGLHANTNVTYSPANFWFANDASLGLAVTTASDHLPVYADFSFGVKTGVQTENILPTGYNLSQNYPNPFNPSTLIKYSISAVGTRHAVSVQLKVYDLLGREVVALVNEEKSSGNYEVKFDGSRLGSGVYFYTLRTGDFVQTKKMLLMK